ncbi:unnamed protein product, partial [Rhizoctonia solani]
TSGWIKPPSTGGLHIKPTHHLVLSPNLCTKRYLGSSAQKFIMEGQLPLGTPAISLNQAEQDIAVRHLDQLSQLSFEEEAPAPSDPEDALPHGLFGSSSPYNDLVQWSKDNAAQIKEAVKNRAFGGPNGWVYVIRR